jgi:nicotinamide riboside transporter PnuC
MTMWMLTAASLVGVVLNIKKKKACFAIWAITNAAWAVIDYMAGLTAQAALFAIYFCLAIWGLVEWRRG